MIDIYKERNHLKHEEQTTKRKALRAKHHEKGTTQARVSRRIHCTKPEACRKIGTALSPRLAER